MNKVYKDLHTINGDNMNFNMDFKAIEVLDVVVRSLLSLVTLFLVTKMLGKKQVSQLSLFDCLYCINFIYEKYLFKTLFYGGPYNFN